MRLLDHTTRALVVVATMSGGLAWGDTITVTTTADVINDDNPAACSLREALQAADNSPQNDDCPLVDDESERRTVVIPGGTYELSLIDGEDDDAGLEGDLDLGGESITVQGSTDSANPTVITLAEGASFRLVHIQGSDNLLSDLTLSGGVSDGISDPLDLGGAGIRIVFGLEQIVLRRVRVMGNEVTQCSDVTADGGAGIWNGSVGLRIVDSVVADNIGGPGSAGATAAEGCPGGGIYSSGSLVLENTEVSGNEAGAGALNASDNAEPGGDGGGIYASAELTVLGGTITDNRAGNGAATTDGEGGGGGTGGGIATLASLVVDGADITLNRAGDGGDADSDGGFGGDGGGVWVNASSATVRDTVVRGNAAGNGGSTSDGAESGWGGDGGGLFLDLSSSGRLERVAVVENSAGSGGDAVGSGDGGYGGNGGGIVNDTDNASFENVTISGNTTGSPGSGAGDGVDGLGAQGGGVYSTAGSSLGLNFSTISGNTAQREGGGSYAPNSLRPRASIIAGNTAGEGGPDCFTVDNGTIELSRYSLIGDSSDCEAELDETDQVDVDPLLGDLADNGGATLTHALLAGSPAIDAVPCDTLGDLLFEDQRRMPRPRGANCDIGAYERPSLVVVETAEEAAGENCPAGGQRIRAGLDLNDNGALDDGETSTEVFVCNGSEGEPGQTGDDATPTLVEPRPIDERDARCPGGGMAIDIGLDANGDGALDAEEVGDSVVLCNGEAGPDGRDGQPASDGTGDGTGGGTTSCTVLERSGSSATITCDDGSEAEISLIGGDGCCATAGGRPSLPVIILMWAVGGLALWRRRARR